MMNLNNDVFYVENENIYTAEVDLIYRNKRLCELYEKRSMYDLERIYLNKEMEYLMLLDNHRFCDFIPLNDNLKDVLEIAYKSNNKDNYIYLINCLKLNAELKKEISNLIQKKLKILYERDNNLIMLKWEKRKINKIIKSNDVIVVKKRGRL